MTGQPRNRLHQSSSPYLLQHADNPVAWQPWDEQALTLARDAGLPILLSIGYSACHWCHVMAHESFENPDIAAVMNRLFVNIKVDREERPDLDRIYQMAHAALARRPGGWPLTVFLDPNNHLPFFAGTYFPDQPRHGMPGFADLLQQISDAFHQRHDEIAAQNQGLQQFFDALGQGARPARPSRLEELQTLAEEEALQQFEPRHGGFGRAPKFPHPSLLRWLLHRHLARPQNRLGEMLTTSLDGMARGGLFDQVGGGFFRYSTDDAWLIPHFEKMLYDNAALLGLYSEAFAATQAPLYAHAAQATADWMIGEMQAEDGGFYAALDADSEGEEGRYYLWTPEAVEALLPAAEQAVARTALGLQGPANFEGRWHLHQAHPIDAVAAQLGLSPAEAEARLDAARQRLLAARRGRVAPGRDDKILAAWNGLAISALAQAGRLLGQPHLTEAAVRAAGFLRQSLWRDGRLLAVHSQGRSHIAAFLDDHAFLLGGLLELLQNRWRSDWLAFAVELAELLLRHFEDPAGGFYFTADDQEALVHRPKTYADEALPAGNGLAAQGLLILGYLLGETRYLDAAERCLAAADATMQQSPLHHASLLRARQWLESPPQIVILRGETGEMAGWLQQLGRTYRPDRLVFAIDRGIDDLPPALATKTAAAGCVAYLCRGFTCSPPQDDPQALLDAAEGSGDKP